MTILKKVFLSLVLSAAAWAVTGLSGCQKEEWNSDPDFLLSFSSDTIIFDTVFTTIGTANQILMVRNNSNLPVKISEVTLARGSASPYRLNIDGVAATKINDLEIAAHDSAFIFVKVTIDPNNQDSPLIETDSIMFLTNGNVQNVKLVAWGQDAIFHLNETLEGTQVFTGVKPHVVYGDLVLDSLCSLTLEAGCKVYFHKKSSLVAKSNSSLIVNGTLADPVILRGDNLKTLSKDTIPGQWAGIFLLKGSDAHYFSFARILNAEVGIWLEGKEASKSRITLYNTVVHNTTNYGLYFSHVELEAANCQVSNSGAYTVVMDNGGSYRFTHCTLADYFPFSARKYPMVYMSNYTTGESGNIIPSPLDRVSFDNCILYGSLDEELSVDTVPQAAFNPSFRYSLIRTGYQQKYSSWFSSCVVNKDPKFVSNYKPDFSLDTLSPALNAAAVDLINLSLLDVTKDLNGYSRLTDEGPDMGAYERQPAGHRKRK